LEAWHARTAIPDSDTISGKKRLSDEHTTFSFGGWNREQPLASNARAFQRIPVTWCKDKKSKAVGTMNTLSSSTDAMATLSSGAERPN
jgi:hypothetical protein